MKTIVQTLFQRRKRRVLAYVFWLIIYCGALSLYAVDHELQLWQILPFLVPIVIAINQIVYPTLFGWAFISIPSFGFTIFCGCYIIYQIINKIIHPAILLLPYEIEVSFIVISIFFGVCIALAFSYPSKIDKHKNNGDAS